MLKRNNLHTLMNPLLTFALFAAVAAPHALATNVTDVRRAYQERRFKELPGLAVSAIQSKCGPQAMDDCRSILDLAEDTAILRLHQIERLKPIYRALLSQKSLPDSLRSRLLLKQSLLEKQAGAKNQSPEQVFQSATRLFEQGFNHAQEDDPVAQSRLEAHALFASGLFQRYLELAPKGARRAEALFRLGLSLSEAFPGQDRAVLTEFIRNFPADKNAPQALEALRTRVESSFAQAGKPAELPASEQALLEELSTLIKKNQK